MLCPSNQSQWGQTTIFKHQSPLRGQNPLTHSLSKAAQQVLTTPPEPAALFGQSLFTRVLPRGNLSSFSLIQGQTHSVARGQSRAQPWSYEEGADNTKPGADRGPGGLNPCQMPTRAESRAAPSQGSVLSRALAKSPRAGLEARGFQSTGR